MAMAARVNSLSLLSYSCLQLMRGFEPSWCDRKTQIEVALRADADVK